MWRYLKRHNHLLIAPEGIEITHTFASLTSKPTLLIAPEGIEINKNLRAQKFWSFLLIAPEGIEISEKYFL